MNDSISPSDFDNGPDQWEVLARFLAGECTPVEAAEIRRWFAENPDDGTVVANLDALLPVPSSELFRSANGIASFTGPLDVEGALRRVHGRMDAPGALQATGRPKLPRTVTVVTSSRPARSRWQIGGIAAAAALMVAMGVSSWKSNHAVASVAVAYDSKIGSADSITLPDSSSVVLAPGSHLVVAANYGANERNVVLDGEARFTVRHDASRPFTVRAGSAVIRDLGTVFGVKTSKSAGITVSVSEGAVSLSDSQPAKGRQAVQLKAGDRGHLMADGSVTSEPGTVTPDELSWVTGRLVYHDATVAEVQADLRRWYGVELVVRDSVLAARSVSTQGLASEPLAKILERVASLVGGVARQSQSGDTAYIDPPGDRRR